MINRLLKTPLIKNIAIISSGAVITQIIAFLSTPVVTRIYGPDIYGQAGILTNIFAIISPVAALTLPMAIVIPKDEDIAHNLKNMSLKISLIFSLLVSVIILFFNNPIIEIFNLEEVEAFLLFIPLAIFLSGIRETLEYWNIRQKNYKLITQSSVVGSIITNLGKIIGGLLNPIAGIIVFFQATRQGVAAFLMGIVGFFYQNKKEYKKISYVKLLQEYKEYPFFKAPQTFIDALTQGLPVLLLSIFFGASSVGFYNVCITSLSIPTTLVGKAVSDVIFPEISNAVNEKKQIHTILKKITLILASLGVIPYGIIFLFGPEIFQLLFGSEWVTAGEYARWISFWSFSSFIINPAIRTVLVLGIQKFHLNYTIISLVVRFFMLFLGYYIYNNDLIAIILFSLTSSAMNLLLLVYIFYRTKKFDVINTDFL